MRWVHPLLLMVGSRFVIRSVIVMTVQSAQPIVAPSYWAYPDSTTEAVQVASAMKTYGVSPLQQE